MKHWLMGCVVMLSLCGGLFAASESALAAGTPGKAIRDKIIARIDGGRPLFDDSAVVSIGGVYQPLGKALDAFGKTDPGWHTIIIVEIFEHERDKGGMQEGIYFQLIDRITDEERQLGVLHSISLKAQLNILTTGSGDDAQVAASRYFYDQVSARYGAKGLEKVMLGEFYSQLVAGTLTWEMIKSEGDTLDGDD